MVVVSGQDGEGRPCTWTPRWPPGSTVLALQPPHPKSWGLNSSGPKGAEKLLPVGGRPLWRVQAVFAGILLLCLHIWEAAPAVAVPAGVVGGRMEPSLSPAVVRSAEGMCIPAWHWVSTWPWDS